MVKRILDQHEKKFKHKFSSAEYSQVEDIICSSSSFLQRSANVLFISVAVVLFILNVITSLVVLPFKDVLPGVLFYGTFAASAFVLGILIVYFIHINPEFERQHHFSLLALLVLFSFCSVFLGHALLNLISSDVVSGTMLASWSIALTASISFILPYLLYWMLVE